MVEYQIGSNTSTWSTFLPYGRRSSDFTIEASDFSGLNATNPNLRLRISYDETNTTLSREILALRFVNCSPEVENITPMNLSCANDMSGGFEVEFNRPLNPGEILTSIAAIRDDDGSGTISSGDVMFQPDPATATYTGTTFIFPFALGSGNYIFRYQSNNQDTPEVSELFTITEPTPLDYEVVLASEISCFNEQNGSVTINIAPGPNNSNIGTPGYHYTRSDDPGAQHFFNSTTTTVNNIGTNPVIIRVFDSNGCTERN